MKLFAAIAALLLACGAPSGSSFGVSGNELPRSPGNYTLGIDVEWDAPSYASADAGVPVDVRPLDAGGVP